MDHRPIIGIAGSHNEADNHISIKQTYIHAILRAGGLPILLPMTEDEHIINELLQHIDGLLLSGGGDIEPSYFGEEIIDACGKPDILRDKFELSITPKAILRNMPVFGICRGVQVLAVSLGGTLVQDIETQCNLARATHYQANPFHVPHHRITLNPDGLLAGITGSNFLQTNSMHHQSIKNPGSELIVEASTEDGIIEAVSMKASNRVFGVQFHPEYLCENDPSIALMFTYFVNQSKKYHFENMENP